ncbi:MAG: NAD(P)/FAD-dependent oxidoreductase, partial [Acetobacteraceae bacterium]|nr:NAD(P)/FAD-dependent oxidoreductase [Acetobacteraceae bacterium]
MRSGASRTARRCLHAGCGVRILQAPPRRLASREGQACNRWKIRECVVRSVICIGAGPAGLTAAYLLGKEGVRVTVLEADPDRVGGISRTVTHKGFGFDIGGHRFFSKSEEVERLWDELADEPMLERPRKSRIYYRGQLFDYPLRAQDALSKLGVVEATRCVLSYARARLNPVRQPRSFEEWVTNQFGRRLFEIFFRTYTEKVWGMKCHEISADWAAQRIKGLSLLQAVWRSLVPQKANTPRGAVVKTLINSFRYPRRGPGMLWEAAAEKVRRQGNEVLLGTRVVELRRDTAAGAPGWVVVAEDAAGRRAEHRCTDVISSMPMRELARALAPAPSPAAVRAAEGLRYRDFLTVALVLKDRDAFDDNWIYIHEPGVMVGRIQNFRSWSPDLVPEAGLTCYGMEYFCFEGDGLWTAPDSDLVERARDELVRLGLAQREDILEGAVVRQPKAYPVYDDAYEGHVAALRREIETFYPGLHLVGRNGMHKYNNQDHAMMTAMLTAKNIVAGRTLYEVWKVNQDAEYHESAATQPGNAAASGLRQVPARL